ncbi:hypothetical protein HDU93_003594 [Gonapodya sp. JEL0774]|nr:hypothetical protein HDU93_003594 [Gonapodya sp. JEL0774]
MPMDYELKKRKSSKSTDAPPSYEEAWIDTLGDGASLSSQNLIPPYKAEGKPNTVLPGDGSSAGACFPRPASTEGRLILDVFGSKFLGERQALAHAVIANPPREVAAKGVKRETWEEWMTKFQEIMKEDSLSVVTSVLAVVSVVGIAYWRHKLIHQQKALAKLQEEFNTQVMEPHGMYFTTATSVLVRHYGESHVMYFVSWITIALTPDECDSLRAEEHRYVFNLCKRTHNATPKWNRFVEKALFGGVKRVV